MKKNNILIIALIFAVIGIVKAQCNVLVNFTGTSGSYPGEYPYGDLILSGDTLFGMTSGEGTKNYGGIFSLSYKILEINKLTPQYFGAKKVYPNSGNGKFTVAISPEHPGEISNQAQLQIYDALGKQVYSKCYHPLAISQQQINIDLRPVFIYVGSLLMKGK